MTNEEFYIAIKKDFGIELSDIQKRQLEEFYTILIEENKKINLTRIVEKKAVYLKHFYDSLTLRKVINLNEVETLCDVGTGAGFPGIVLKIVYPKLKIILIDSLLKRVNYLNATIKKLNLNNIEAIHSRSEDYHEKFDIVTTRAVASLDKLVPWCSHLIGKNGKLVAMKANLKDEIEKSTKVLNKYKCKITKKEEFLLPIEDSMRTLVVIEK